MSSLNARTDAVSRNAVKYETIEPQKVPEYFEITDKYDKLRVGHVSSPITLVDCVGYDYFILAGVNNNELFSKLVMMNMDVGIGCAIDTNLHIDDRYHNSMKFLRKNVDHRQDEVNENLGYFIDRFSNMFLRMDIKGGEYLWVLSQTPESLCKFKQIVITFYQINQNPTEQRAINKIKCFTKLKSTHNIAFMNYNGLDLTITYMRKDHSPELVSSENNERKHVSNTIHQQERREKSLFKQEDQQSNTLSNVREKVAEDKAKKDAEDKAKKEAEDKAKKEAEDKTKKDAEDKAKKDAEDKVNAEEERIREEESKIQAQIAEAEAKMREEIAKAEAKMQEQIAEAEKMAMLEKENVSTEQHDNSDKLEETAEKIGVELSIQETSTEQDTAVIELEIDEASSDDEEDEKERERLKQLSISKTHKKM